MTCAKWLTLGGGALLLCGLLTALLSTRYAGRVMGETNLGVGVWGAKPDSEFMRQKRSLRARADCWFKVGLWLTAFGVIGQTLGGILPLGR